MSYTKSIYENQKLGEMEIHKYYPLNYGAPGMQRGKRASPTPNAVKRQNAWKKKEELRRLIQLNFNPGDPHMTLTFKKELRPKPEDVPKIRDRLIRRIKREYKKQGWSLKWICVCETGSRGAVHFHLILNGCHNNGTDTTQILNNAWDMGNLYIVPLYKDTSSYGTLAGYLTKEAVKKINDYRLADVRYSRSRNLIKPVEKKETVKEAVSWTKKPKAPKGWYVVQVLNGLNRYTGLPYQRYTIRKGKPPKGFEPLYINPETWWNLEPYDEAYTDEKRKEETDAGG